MIFKRDNLEYEFLPPALEISETPPSPLGRFTIWFIFLGIIIALVWSYLGKIDEVAVARGKVIPDKRVKVIQPLEEGVVTAIHVNEGQKVSKGQLLLELDSTITEADVVSLKNSLDTAKLERDIYNAELKGQSADKLLSGKELPSEALKTQKDYKEARDLQYTVKRDTLKQIILQKKAEMKAQESTLKEMEKKTSMVREEEERLKKQYEKVSIPKKEWEDKKDELNIAEAQLETQKMNVQYAKGQLGEAEKNFDSLAKERQATLLNSIVETDKKIENLQAEYIKANERFQYQTIYSPVDGLVNGLSVNTVGGVVTPAQPLMTIVPLGTPLIVEATVQNKDIGFIRAGQETEIKFDTFSFQKYGTIKGTVIEVSPDAFEDEKLGPVYKIKVKLAKTTIRVENKDIDINPGMAVSVEVKTGKRRAIEFFLEPIIKYLDESLKLR
jgi:hemolysin D